jgi:hypothetical protein
MKKMPFLLLKAALAGLMQGNKKPEARLKVYWARPGLYRIRPGSYRVRLEAYIAIATHLQ